MSDHVLTLVAYTVVATLVGVAFWRAHRGTVGAVAHVVVSALFGLLWPLSLPYQALVRFLGRVSARRRMRRQRAVDETPLTQEPR